MADQADIKAFGREIEVLRGLLNVGAALYGSRDHHEMLETILSQARNLTGAEAGSLFLVRENRLKFVAVQNDKVDTSDISRYLLDRDMPISVESLAGFVALTGRIMNIPDSYNQPEGTPFRINRDFDARTGYSTKSILAIPLNCPDGRCVGVLQLINRLDDVGRPAAFPDPAETGVLLLVSSASITVHNVALQEELRQAHLNTIFRLSMVAEYRDDDTSRHIRRVSRTSEYIAQALGMDSDQVELIKYASPMHDVGKVAIPDAILLKPGHLTSEQREAMQRHTIIGADILSEPDDDVLSMARDIALCHHERWDGKGYPKGIRGEAIPLPARIVGLADVFDAIVSRRCYKRTCSLDVALTIIDGDSGKHFDPAVVKAFLTVLDKVLGSYPSLGNTHHA